MKKALIPFVLAGALTAAFAAPVAAQTECTTPVADTSRGGGPVALAGLIAAAVQAQVGANVCDVTINVLNDSLNNLLQNADIDVLNNSLNNLLRNADIDVNVLNNSTIEVDVLSGDFEGQTFNITLVPAP